jgi:L-iditol 2-dehydrogenase
MRAAVYTGIGSIEERALKTPQIDEGEVLLKVMAAAICGTDLRVYRGGTFCRQSGGQQGTGA